MRYLATAFAVLLSCSTATAQTSTAPRPAPPVVHKTPAAPAQWDSVTGEQRNQLARSLCEEGYPLDPDSVKASGKTIGELSWEVFYDRYLVTCRSSKEQVEAALKSPADDKVGTGERKNAPPPRARGLPRCEVGTFDPTLGRCTQANVTARQAED